jgi:polyhydroxybutyrate depolymerase
MIHLRSGSRAARSIVIGLSLALAMTACASGGDGGADRPTSTTTAPSARASAGCGQAPPVETAAPSASRSVPLTITVGQQPRAYRLAVPQSYDKRTPAPVVMNLHGSGASAAVQDALTAMPKQAAERGFITITPDARNGVWEFAAIGPDDDFLTALLEDVTSRYCVDLDRVHLAGHSLGAWKTAVTACAHPGRFASIALVAVEVHPGDCDPIPVVAFHGTADAVVPYGVGADPGIVVRGSNAGLTGVEVNMPQWAEGAQCSAEKQVERIEPDIVHWTYRGCPKGMGVEFYSIVHGSHMWPGSPLPLPGVTHTIDATKLALDWFEAHPRSADRAGV